MRYVVSAWNANAALTPAKALGLDVPLHLERRADKMIECVCSRSQLAQNHRAGRARLYVRQRYYVERSSAVPPTGVVDVTS
jgi:hypothetical protein